MIRIRFAEERDAPALAGLATRVVDRCYRDFLGDATVDRWLAEGRVEASFNRSLTDCIVIASGEEPMGYARCEGNLIRLLVIDPDRQRRGLGTRLLRGVESEMFTRQARLWMESYAGNRAAAALSARCGWRAVSRYEDPDLATARVVYEKDRVPG